MEEKELRDLKDIVTFEHVHFKYDDTPVIKDVSFSIHGGEKIGLVGNNGAGKSTIFKLFLGIIKPEKGVIKYMGNPLKNRKDYEELHKNIGLVFQNPSEQIIAPTVRSEICFAPNNMGVPQDEIQDRLEQVLEQMDLERYVDYSPFYLSGGEKKRVCISDVIIVQPKILLFDEPTNSLDNINKKIFLNHINQLADKGYTIIVSTHDIDFLYSFVDRVIVIDEGELVIDDGVDNFFSYQDILENLSIPLPSVLKVSRAFQDFYARSKDGDIGWFEDSQHFNHKNISTIDDLVKKLNTFTE